MITHEKTSRERKVLIDHPSLTGQIAHISIEHLAKEDLSALEWGGTYLHYRRLYRDAYQSMCAGEAILWVVRKKQDGIIGQLFAQLIGARRDLADGIHRSYLYAFRIKPAYRNMGIGSLFLKTVEVDLFQRGFRFSCLNVAWDNLDAQKFYQRHGYKIVGEEPGHWSYFDHQGRLQHVHEPSWKMEKDLHLDK